MSMESPLDRDEAIKILGKAIDRACKKCESFINANRIDSGCWEMLNEIGTVFKEHGYPKYDVQIKISKSIRYRTKEVLRMIKEKEQQRKFIEEILIEELFDYPA